MTRQVPAGVQKSREDFDGVDGQRSKSYDGGPFHPGLHITSADDWSLGCQVGSQRNHHGCYEDLVGSPYGVAV